MKQTLLLLCAIPCLLTAQTVTKKELKENPFFQQLVKNPQTSDPMMLRSGNTNLPDSIYTYSGEEKVLESIEAITYDENERRKEVNVKVDLNDDGVITDDEVYKVEYTYTQKEDVLEEEIVGFYNIEDKWLAFSKVIAQYNTHGNYLDRYEYMYDFENEKWLDGSKWIVEDLDEKGNAIAALDSTLDGDEWTTMYWEIKYDAQNRYDTIFSYDYDEIEKKKGIAVEKMEFVYGENGKQIENIFYDYKDSEWVYSHTVEYSYDDKENLISVKEIEKDGEIKDSEYYTNIYSSDVSNEKLFSVESAIYPNPVSDVLNVTINGADLAVIKLINANGSIVIQQKVQQSTATIPVSSLPKGYYFLTVQTTQGTKTHKIIIK